MDGSVRAPIPCLLRRFTKESFEEFGEYGFWKRGTILRGADATGKVRQGGLLGGGRGQ